MSPPTIDEFDPYHIWLGIPKSEQPASPYRLLGVSEFENNEEVIKIAFLQRMSLLQALSAGPKKEIAAQLLEELVQAKLLLLDPLSRQAYDATLRGNIAAPAAPAALQVCTVRRRQSHGVVYQLIQIAVGAVIGIGGGLAILKYVQSDRGVEVTAANLPVEANVPREKSEKAPSRPSRDESVASPPPFPAVNEDAVAPKEPMPSNQASTDEPPPSAPDEASSQSAPSPAETNPAVVGMGLYELRKLQLELPENRKLFVGEVLPDINAMHQEIASQLKEERRKGSTNVVGFADANGRDYAYVSRSGGDQNGSFLVLNRDDTPTITGTYRAGKRAGTVMMLDDDQEVIFAAQFKNRAFHGFAMLFDHGRPVVVVECQPKLFNAVHRFSDNELVSTFAPAKDDPEFSAIIESIEEYENSYMEVEKVIRKLLADMDEDARQQRANEKNLEVRGNMAARRRARAAENAAIMESTMRNLRSPPPRVWTVPTRARRVLPR